MEEGDQRLRRHEIGRYTYNKPIFEYGEIKLELDYQGMREGHGVGC